MEEECLESDVDQIQVCIKECFVYQIPALRTSQGHRAEDWKLETPLFTGALRVYQRRNDLRVIVYREPPLSMQPTDDSPHSIFAECPISLNPTEGDMLRFVDGVIDSSRYFVLRVKDSKSERSTYIGVGFRERETAFEFRNCLNDYIRFVGRAHRAKAGAPRVVRVPPCGIAPSCANLAAARRIARGLRAPAGLHPSQRPALSSRSRTERD